ncbi:alanine acetyltransferase [Paenibacillus sp. J45TS6]|uniref:GNAT family N-acetyltransferase n=1 Tax=Paenibacillus sp. J45TS6 TaxID=2807196 RepID=UPI001B0EDB3B|nr:GNAT family N-acetyltransferase [Paenibacillus sp. J45TS6]GIP43047.1 alanine acetyltransferase [Paenibacillus sp. J45TS6]
MNKEVLFTEEPVFETERMILRRLDMDDLEEYFSFSSDPLVSERTLWDRHESTEDTRVFLEKVQRSFVEKIAYRWAVIYKPERRLIGRIGFIHLDEIHSCAEIGYALSSRYWGKGITTEGLQEVIKYGISHMNINRIEGRCNVDNLSSARVMKKVGMQQEGILREKFQIKGEFVDQIQFAMIRKEVATRNKKALAKGVTTLEIDDESSRNVYPFCSTRVCDCIL